MWILPQDFQPGVDPLGLHRMDSLMQFNSVSQLVVCKQTGGIYTAVSKILLCLAAKQCAIKTFCKIIVITVGFKEKSRSLGGFQVFLQTKSEGDTILLFLLW